ncbi:MAG: hypothetical protein GWN71_22525, partial [Gammaproteobacteria bacterium]|nr:hypothetical protein [Gemmatimonadota bacterium]NIU76234.1 hypothetical protein [Gammaproteobacteria bacterium]NIY09291.1 hypothetical protein [Gemmatimonadota bacterium]
AVEVYTGPFLDGFSLSDAPEFEHWADGQRTRLSDLYGEALETLADDAEGQGELADAVAWWKARATHDPFDSRVALRLMQALVATGNPAGALQHAAAHRRLLAEELDLELPADLAALTERLRSEPVPPTGQGREPLVRKTADRPLTAARPGSDRTASPAQRPSPTGDPGPRPRRLHLALRYGLAAILLGAVVLLAMRLGSESLAEAVAREMGRQEPGNSALPPPEQRTRSTRAYELYSAASDPDSLRGDRSARRSLRSCQDAVALDSTYAAAWACVARFALRVMLDPQMSGSTDGLLAQAEAAASRAVALDGSTGMNHATLGVVRLAGFELRDAEAHLVRATDLDPDHPLIRQWLVGLYLWTGRTEEALAEARRALELAPADAAAKAEYARALAARDRCREALDVLEEIRDLEPPLLRRVSIAARCHARNGAWQEAIELLRAQSHRGKVGDGLEGYMLARAGRIGEARALRSHLVDRWRQNGTGALGIAAVSAGLGETDEAFAWLDRALEDRSLVPYEFQYQTLAIIA